MVTEQQLDLLVCRIQNVCRFRLTVTSAIKRLDGYAISYLWKNFIKDLKFIIVLLKKVIDVSIQTSIENIFSDLYPKYGN